MLMIAGTPVLAYSGALPHFSKRWFRDLTLQSRHILGTAMLAALIAVCFGPMTLLVTTKPLGKIIDEISNETKMENQETKYMVHDSNGGKTPD